MSYRINRMEEKFTFYASHQPINITSLFGLNCGVCTKTSMPPTLYGTIWTSARWCNPGHVIGSNVSVYVLRGGTVKYFDINLEYIQSNLLFMVYSLRKYGCAIKHE